MSKAKKKAELETEELRAALEEAEGALELEEVRNCLTIFHKQLFVIL